jgi:predicted transcriptional regulator
MVELEKVEKKEIKEIKEKEPKETKEAPIPKERSLPEILLHTKPAKLLVLLLQDKQWNTASLARESGQSYVYATEMLKLFEKAGIISFVPMGKKRTAKLTEKGERAARLASDLFQLQAEATPKEQPKQTQ